MSKNIIFSLLIFFILTSSSFSNSKIFISATIDNEIITNYDIKKESEYLKILNPNLKQLNNNRILELAKDSLIKEIIKKKEITKFKDLDKEYPLVNEYLTNLFTKLNYNNEKDFIKDLSKKDTYTLNQIKEKIKIELMWNELIFKKYNKQVRINKINLIKKVDNLSNKVQKDYLLSEILFEKKKEDNLETLINQIQLSINEIGFGNTANIYSISESSKLGGKLGWVKENNLSEIILSKLKLIKTGQHTDVIKIGNNFLILKIEEIKTTEVKINKKQELDRLIRFETNKQLNQFSHLYFNKIKKNIKINEL